MVVVYDTEINIMFNIHQPFRDVLQISKSENVQKPPATGTQENSCNWKSSNSSSSGTQNIQL